MKPHWIGAIALIACPLILSAQAITEYGLGTARSGAVGAGGKNASTGIKGVFDNLSKKLESANEAKPAAAAAPAKSAPAAKPSAAAASAEPAKPDAAAPAAPAVIFEDPEGINTGMERAELLQRFGEPSVKVATGPGREFLTYEGKERRVVVDMRDGKVVSVQTMARPKQAAAVVAQ